jgi:prephenate dehydrogenase
MAACPAVVDATEERRAAAARLPPRIAFLGFGLIGGSIALALREAGYGGRLAAWTPNGSGPAEGLRRGIVDEAPATSQAALANADLVILAGPPLAVLAWLGESELEQAVASGVTATDVASTKGMLIASAEARSLPFVGGHPMAGRETSGVSSAAALLFVDRPWVIVAAAAARERDIDRVTALAAAAGARPIRMTADEHDLAVAAISHLPLVVAAALVESAALSSEGAGDWPVARALAATGWSDMTRLARGGPDMGAGILATNSAAVASRLRAFRDAIDDWLRALEGRPSPDAIRERLEAARDALTEPPR